MQTKSSVSVFYSFELQLAGVILLTAMAMGGISLWLKRRREEKESDSTTVSDNVEH